MNRSTHPARRARAVAVALFAAALGVMAALPPMAVAGRNRTAAMWLSIGHPGLGEYYLRNWGPFDDHCPQNKFWLGFIPLYGWPGYLQVLSAIDAYHGRTSDNLTPVH